MTAMNIIGALAVVALVGCAVYFVIIKKGMSSK